MKDGQAQRNSKLVACAQLVEAIILFTQGKASTTETGVTGSDTVSNAQHSSHQLMDLQIYVVLLMNLLANIADHVEVTIPTVSAEN